MSFITPMENDIRIVKRFAFLPIYCLKENTKKWLEICYIKQTYSPILGWSNISWAKKEEFEAFKEGKVKHENISKSHL